MKKKYGYEGQEMHKLFFRVLEGYEDPAEEETLYGVMNQIQEYFDSCYWIGINPLPGIRRILPQYEWRFHRSKDYGLIRKIISDSQLIWRTNWIEDGFTSEPAEEIQLVTANKIGQSSEVEKLFFAGEKKKLERSTDRIDFVKRQGGDPVYCELFDEEWMQTPEGQKWLKTPIKRSKSMTNKSQSLSEKCVCLPR